MANYYCTCQSKRDVNKQKYAEHKKLHPTVVDSEGICKHCGYYAIAKPNSSHIHFPRPDYKKWDTEPTTSRTEWAKLGLLNEYYLYFHGHEQRMTGLNDATLKKDQERIRNERRANSKVKRAGGSRS